MDLQYYKIFKEDTSQGIVGLLRPLNKKKSFKVFTTTIQDNLKKSTNYFFVEDEPCYPMFVFKIPKDVSTLLDHEYKVSKSLEPLSCFLPNFNRVLEVKRNIKCYIPENKKILFNASYNPFSKYNCVRDASIIEYIPSKLTLLKYLQETNFTGCSEALLHQLILALFIAQNSLNFTHYDLHLENILLRRCFKRTFFWYKFEYEEVVLERLILTDGYFPVIFDYGFAFTKDLENTTYNNSLFFTNKGYTPFKFDDIVDFKTLIVRLAFSRNCPKKFKDLADEKFLKTDRVKFKIDKETGWIKSTVSSAGRVVSRRLEKTILEINSSYKDKFIFKELDNIVDLFGVLIKIPMDKTTFKNGTLKESVKTFLEEWEKIDEWFSEDFADDKLNIIKRMFEALNNLIEEFQDYEEIVRNFKLKLFEIFDGFGDFVNVKNINYGSFLSSIIELSNFIEYVSYAEIQRCQKLFNLSHCMDGWDLFNSLESIVSTKTPYQFQKSDSIVLFDCMEQTTSSFELLDFEVINALNIAGSLDAQISLLNSLNLENFN